MATAAPASPPGAGSGGPTAGGDGSSGGGLRMLDIGANLTDPMYQGVYHGKERHEPDLDLVLERSWAAGLTHVMVTGGNLEDSERALELCELDPRLVCTVGCHPTRCNAFLEDPEYMAKLLALIEAHRDRVVAVGEW